ncbi:MULTISPECIES: CaiB/BaiF CoA transferase family protein [Xanthobacter]|uniref:CaiB/BaiF CoA transferase family protein n=1 Tax=Xanthobacter TaxID=279 RepID=UPI0035B0DCE1
MSALPLEGIRVLDLSRILAGPWAGQYLADLGAEVFKIERAGKGDDARYFGPPYLPDESGAPTSESFFHLSCNRGKKSVTADLASPEGQEIIRTIASDCDVVIENFKVGDLARYGLDYASLREVNPRLVYCSLTGFGQTGPYRKRPGYDAVFQGMSGLMSVTGLPDGEPGGGPMKVGPSIADIVTGLNAVIGILAALRHRDHNGGEGQQIDLSLFESMVAALSHYAQIFLTSGVPPFRRGTQGNGGVPSQMFRCADSGIMLTAGNDAQFHRLCEAIGHPQMGRDPRFSNSLARISNRAALSAELEAIFVQKPAAHWLAVLEAAEVPAGPIYDFKQVFEDTHIVSRGLKIEVDHPYNGRTALIGSPLHFSNTPIDRYGPPPLLGQHTDETLERYGYDEARRAELRRKGVI